MEWIIKQSHTIAEGVDLPKGTDILIYSVKNKDNENGSTIIKFLHKCWYRINSKNHSLYIKVGLSGTRLYFAEAEKNTGFKLNTFTKDGSTCVIKLQSSKLPITNIEKGSYKLMYDPKEKLCYIDITNKLSNIDFIKKY